MHLVQHMVYCGSLTYLHLVLFVSHRRKASSVLCGDRDVSNYDLNGTVYHYR